MGWSPQRLLITGMPGWLSAAFLEDLARAPLPDLQEVCALVHPDVAPLEAQLRVRCPLVGRFSACDLGEPQNLERILDGIDVVLHSAGVIHVRRPDDWYRINTRGTLALLRAARQAGVRRFVFISSNAAGGRSSSGDRLLTEEDAPKPMSHYGRSKWLAEQGALQLHEPGKFEVVILRPSMFYGPPVPQRHVEVYQLILRGRMPLVGAGEFARSLTYIDNLVQACRLALCHSAAAGQTYYVTDSPVYTTRRIYEAMASALRVPLRIIQLPRIVGPTAQAADHCLTALGFYWQRLHLLGESHWHVGVSSEKARRELGYNPAVELESGMSRAIQWCREHGEI